MAQIHIEDIREKIQLVNGDGVLELVGTDFDAALLLNSLPLAFNWCDGEGSIGQYLLRSQVERDYTDQLKSLRRILDGHIQTDLPLSTQISLLLDLFKDGCYELALRQCEEWCFEEFSQIGQGLRNGSSLYPYPDDFFVATQPSTCLDHSTVKRFEDLVTTGLRPIPIVGWILDHHGARGCFSYVIDGHHKLTAYKNLNCAPRVIEIICLKPSSNR